MDIALIIGVIFGLAAMVVVSPMLFLLKAQLEASVIFFLHRVLALYLVG